MNSSFSFFFKQPLLLAAIALTTLSFTAAPQQETSHTKVPPLDGNRTEDIRRLQGKETVADFRGVAKKAIPAVVSIKVQSKKRPSIFSDESQEEDPFDLFGSRDFWQFFGIPKKDLQPFQGQASGVIVNSEGYIVTNSHVVHGMDNIMVQFHDGREFIAKVLGEDQNSDLAIIKVDAKDLPYLTLGNSDDLEVGQWVAAIGNPFGLQATLTVGVVSAKSRNNLDIARYEDFIQTDVAINRGNSGGPLITLDGEVVGINTAIATNASAGYVGIGFAIPSDMVKHVMDEIISQGKVTRGLLGVSLQSIDYNLAKAFGLKKVEGAIVSNVAKNSAAERAGLQVEDIILRFNDRPVENAATLRNVVYKLKPGTQVTLTVLRKEKLLQIPVTVGDYSDEPSLNSPISQKNQLGIEVETLTPDIAQKLGYTQEQGVVITKINPYSSAAIAGLKKGAVILAVNRKKVTNVSEFNQEIEKTPKDTPILLQVKQGDAYIFFSLQTE